MFGLSLRLALRSGREGLVRLLLTAAAVALGVGILLLMVADFHAYQVTSNRPYWEGTQGSSVSTVPADVLASTPNAELWNFSQDYFDGQIIERLDVAALGPDAPVVPGISALPQAGQYYVSPALESLLQTTPAGELGDRFPGSEVGIIGNQALSGPDALVIIIGHTPEDMAAWPNAMLVDAINTSPQALGTNNVYRIGFPLAAIALLIPMLILIETATRLGAARREERYASMRLLGATPRQIGIIASVDAAAGALLGAVLGIGIFFLLQPTLAGIKITGDRFFASDVTPTVWGFIIVLLAVPLASAAASIFSLRRVQLSPLDVRRRVTPPAPKTWGLLALALGILLFVLSSFFAGSGGPLLPGLGLVLVMLGLMASGPWLTRQAARLLTRFTRGASSLIAARRLDDAPQTAFRSVSGLVLAVLVGTAIAVIASTVLVGSNTPQNAALDNILRVYYPEALQPQTGDALMTQLRGLSGVTILPLYANPAIGGKLIQPGTERPPADVISCQDLMNFPIFGVCPPGATAVLADATQLLLDDNPLFFSQDSNLVNQDSQAYAGDVSSLPVAALMVRVDNPATLEEVRTLLSPYTFQFGSGTPQTFGEVAQARISLIDLIDRIIYAAIALILIVAGCSLALAVMGSLIERQRPFTLLRLSGTPVSALYRVVLLESVLPLVTSAVLAAAIGLGLSVAFILGVAPGGIAVAYPGEAYYLTMGAGFIIAIAVILLSALLLGRLTNPENARFE